MHIKNVFPLFGEWKLFLQNNNNNNKKEIFQYNSNTLSIEILIWGCPLVIAPVLIYSIHLLFPLCCFQMQVLCSAEILCNEAGLVLFFVVLCYIQSFLFMLSNCFRWFLVFLPYYGSLLQKYMQIFYFVKNERQNHALCYSCKKKKIISSCQKQSSWSFAMLVCMITNFLSSIVLR